MSAVALIDGRVMPEQYHPERIRRKDVQGLLKKVEIKEKKEYSRAFPEHMMSQIQIKLKNGKHLETEKKDYEGFTTKPASWEFLVWKFNELTKPFTTDKLRSDIIAMVKELEKHQVSSLTELLARVKFK